MRLNDFIYQILIDHYYIATVIAIWASALLLFLLVYLIHQRRVLMRQNKYRQHKINLMRRIVEAGHVYLFITDKHGKIIDVHPGIQTLLGLQRSQLMEKNLKLFLEEDTRGQQHAWEIVHDEKQPYQLDLNGEWRDGEKFSLNAEIRPILSGETLIGFVVNRVGTLHIGENERSSAELERAEAKEEAIVESIGDGVVVTDEDDIVILANKAALEILGLDPDGAVGTIVYEVMQLEDENEAMLLPQHHPLREAMRDSRRVMTRAYYVVREDFTKIALAITASPVVVDDKTVGGAIVFRDITREKDVDRAKTEFVSLASHQLRTPLTTISWYTELLLGTGAENLSKTQKDYLGVIYDGNKRMVGLVNALLNVSRLELGTFIIEPEATQIVDLIESVLRDVEPTVQEKQHNVSFTYDDSLNGIMVDPRLMRMIVQNLLTNAIKYTPEKGIIHIDISKHYPDMILSVTDNGYGIPQDQQDRIFTKLFRADNVMTKNTEGTGLGLYIIKSVLDRAGGRVWFESEEDRGTTFYIAIPLDGMKAKSGTKPLS